MKRHLKTPKKLPKPQTSDFIRPQHKLRPLFARKKPAVYEKNLIFFDIYGILIIYIIFAVNIMNKINYQSLCDSIISEADGGQVKPTLLLHVCCAPCSSYVIEYLEDHFDLTLFFHNPNITETEEYALRLDELSRFVVERPGKNFKIMTPKYDPDEFFGIAKGLEAEPEGGDRCTACYRLRLEKTAKAALDGGFDYFTTTLSVSPYKNSEKLNTIGLEMQEKYGVRYLVSDFKKKGGYLRSIELSSVYGLYRQDYCGCIFSAAEAEMRRKLNSDPQSI